MNFLDPRKLVLGFNSAKGKKGKTKCQRPKVMFQPKLRDQLSAEPGHTVRQCSKKKFIVTDKRGSKLVDYKRSVTSSIEADSRVGRRFAEL